MLTTKELPLTKLSVTEVPAWTRIVNVCCLPPAISTVSVQSPSDGVCADALVGEDCTLTGGGRGLGSKGSFRTRALAGLRTLARGRLVRGWRPLGASQVASILELAPRLADNNPARRDEDLSWLNRWWSASCGRAESRRDEMGRSGIYGGDE